LGSGIPPSVTVWDAEHLDVATRINIGTGGAVVDRHCRVAVASGEDGDTIWNLADGSVVCRLPDRSRTVTAVALMPASDLLILGCSGGELEVWDLAVMRGRRPGGRHPAHTVALSSGVSRIDTTEVPRRLLVVGTNDGDVVCMTVDRPSGAPSAQADALGGQSRPAIG
jgi:hypothetical protein